MPQKKTVCSYKDIRMYAEQQDADGKFVPYSICALSKNGELIKHDSVVHVPIRVGDEKGIRRQRRGIRRFKILSSGEIRDVYETLIIDINGVRFLTSINGTIYE